MFSYLAECQLHQFLYVQRVHELNPEWIGLLVIKSNHDIVRVYVAMVLPMLIQTCKAVERLQEETPDVGLVREITHHQFLVAYFLLESPEWKQRSRFYIFFNYKKLDERVFALNSKSNILGEVQMSDMNQLLLHIFDDLDRAMLIYCLDDPKCKVLPALNISHLVVLVVVSFESG